MYTNHPAQLGVTFKEEEIQETNHQSIRNALADKYQCTVNQLLFTKRLSYWDIHEVMVRLGSK